MKESRARALATRAFEPDTVVLGPAEELDQGWRFPLVAENRPGLLGAIVNKQTGRVLRLFRDSPFDRDPALYDRGYHAESYDLVVLATDDVEATVRVLMSLQLSYREPYYHDGGVQRAERPMTEDVVRERLSAMPGIFTTGASVIDLVEGDRETVPFEYELLEYWP